MCGTWSDWTLKILTSIVICCHAQHALVSKDYKFTTQFLTGIFIHVYNRFRVNFVENEKIYSVGISNVSVWTTYWNSSFYFFLPFLWWQRRTYHICLPMSDLFLPCWYMWFILSQEGHSALILRLWLLSQEVPTLWLRSSFLLGYLESFPFCITFRSGLCTHRKETVLIPFTVSTKPWP